MINELKHICEINENFDLKNYNTLKLDSKCKCIVFPSNEDELIQVLKLLKNEKHFVMGNASNIVLPRFYDGYIIKLSKFKEFNNENDIVYAQSGVMINKLATTISNMGYSGLDPFTGIPGTIGGCIYGNAGCFGSSMSEVLIDARVYDGKDIITLKNEDFKFNYRYSMLKENKNFVILSSRFKVEKGNVDVIKQLILERTNKRVSTQDLKNPSNGSMFRNPENASAGKLIDDLGLKGYSVGGAMVSNIHANFIVNKSNATQEDIIELVKYIKSKVKEKYNIDLVLEQEIIK